MYFKTHTTNVLDKCIDIMETFNEEAGLDVALKLVSSEGMACGSLNVNIVNNILKDVTLNPARYEDMTHNRVYIYTILHEIGHAYDAINFHHDINAYGNKYRKNLFQYEMTAWELGIKWALEHGFINRLNYRNLKKYMNHCLESYSEGKYNVTEVIETIFSQIEGGK